MYKGNCVFLESPVLIKGVTTPAAQAAKSKSLGRKWHSWRLSIPTPVSVLPRVHRMPISRQLTLWRILD